MKKFLLLLCVILPYVSQAQLTANVHARYPSFTPGNLSETTYLNLADVSSGLPEARKKTKGKGLMIAGGILFAAGVSMIATSDGVVTIKMMEDKGNGTYGAADMKAEAGTLLMVAGASLFVPAVIVYSKSKKRNQAYEAENKASLHMQGAGLRLRWTL